MVEKLKQHPVAAAGAAAAAAAGVGLGIMVVQGVRNALRGSDRAGAGGRPEEDQDQEHERDTSDQEPSAEQQEGVEEGQEEEDAGEDEEGGEAGEEDDEDDGPEGRADDEDEGDIEGSADSGEQDEGDDAADNEDDRGGESGRQQSRQRGLSRVGSALRSSASAARERYERGKQFAAENWHSHPLFIGGVALAAGAAAAMLLPPSSLEDTLMGKAADRVNDRLRQATGGLLGQGKGVLSRALTEAADTAAREAEREGLTPERLGRKVKHVVGQIRQAVAETVE